jgi:hypothetical protein
VRTSSIRSERLNPNAAHLESGLSLSGDIQLNDDDSPETFEQRFADLAVFPDGSVAVVWEDDRNGDFGIFGQRFSALGDPIASETKLVNDGSFSDERMPSCDVDSAGRVILVWVGADGSIHAQAFDNDLNPATYPVTINDDTEDNHCNLPDVVWLSGGGAAVVWEDSRDGVNAFCQLLGPTLSPVGVNFQLSNSSPETAFWAPRLASAGSHGFAVSWDAISAVGAGVLMRIYAIDGSPRSGLIALPDAIYSSADQFSAAAAHLAGTGFIAFWLDTRNNGQRVFAQRVDYTGIKIGSNISMCDDPNQICWDIAADASSNGTVRAAWASHSEFASIITSALTSSGVRSGSNTQVSSAGIAGDRFSPRIDCASDDGAVTVWTDLRSGEADVAIRFLDSSGLPEGGEKCVASPATGAQQIEPQIALTDHGVFGAAWEDRRFDEGDVFVQFVSEDGILIGDNLKVNQDIGRALQCEPTIGSNGEGQAIVAWVDARQTEESAGQRVFARRYRFSAPDDNEVCISDDVSGAMKDSPDAAYSISGQSAVTWQDFRNGAGDIYVQLISADGNMTGSNNRVNTSSSMGVCASPRVGMAADGSFVVAWLAEVGPRDIAFYQLYSSSGTPFGANTMYPCDSPDITHSSLDVDYDQKHSAFVIAVIQTTDAGENAVIARRFSSTGVPLGGEIAVSDNSTLEYRDVSVSVDHEGFCGVTWSDSRSGHSRIYCAIPGIHGVQSVSDAIHSEQQHSGVALSGRVRTAIWMGSREEAGNDILVGSYNYSATSADEQNDDLLPGSFELAQNYPNPFNPSTTISFFIPTHSDVSLEVLNLLGQVVYTERQRSLPAGWHHVVYDATDNPSGIYFYRVSSDRSSSIRKMALIK